MYNPTCAQCGETFEAKRSDARCCSKACSRRAYYALNRDREAAAFKAWREANLDHERQRWSSYYAANADRLTGLRRAAYYSDREAALARAADWRARNPGRGDAWRKANPEKWALRNRENQRRRRGDKPVDYAAILGEHGMVCHICTEPIASLDDLHFDHVVPLAKGGPHEAENIRPAHATCNLRKGVRLIA